jgi:hypothetical protein
MIAVKPPSESNSMNAELDLAEMTGLLPVCSWCKKVRDHRGVWRLAERLVDERFQGKLTHGICPACRQKLYLSEFCGN